MSASILFDIGGTKIRIGKSTDGKIVTSVMTSPTPANFEEGMSVLEKIVKEVAKGDAISRVAGGIAGVLNKDGKSLFHSPNLEAWQGKPLFDEIKNHSGASSVKIENDAALAGLGEAHFGAGRGFNSVMYMTVSTGVGGAKIIGGKIDQKVFGFEPGQQIINGDRLEEKIGGAAIKRRRLKEASEIPHDDPMWDTLADDLAIGLHNSILHWSPEIIILGGSIILGDAIKIEKVENKLKDLLKIFPEIPPIKKASLGHEAGLNGALILAQEDTVA